MSEFTKVLWYLKRPRLYPQLIYRYKKKLFGKSYPKELKQQAKLWCAKNAIDTKEAILKLTKTPLNKSVRDVYPSDFIDAEEKASKVPVRMGGAANLDLLYLIAEYVQAKKIVETGVAFGWSSLALLLSLEKRAGSTLISTDMPYPNRDNDQYVGCVVPERLNQYWMILNYADRQAIPKALKKIGTIDMCHYDSDKNYFARLWAYPRLWDALRTGGFFISDDIGDNLAFCDFANKVKADPVVVKTKENYVGVLIKY
jgi:predicted O-methyltransferase YrrM